MGKNGMTRYATDVAVVAASAAFMSLVNGMWLWYLFGTV